MHRAALPAVFCAVLLVAVVSPALSSGVADSGAATDTATWEMSVSDSIETPSRTVTFEGQTFDVSGVSVADPGGSVSVEVTGPDEVYRVYLYNGEEQIEASKRGTGDGSFTFDLSDYEPGSYVLTVYHDGNYQTVHPLVVRGYDVSVSAPSTVTEGERFNATVEVTEMSDVPAPDSVEAVIADSEGETRVTATQETESGYVVTVAASDLSTGEYALYAGVRIDETAFGERALVGVSGSSTITVEEARTTTPSSTTTPSDGGGGSSPGGGSETTRPATTTTDSGPDGTTPTTTTSTTAATLTSTANGTESTVSRTTVTSTDAPTDNTTTTDSTTGDDGVLTPGGSTTSTDESDTSGQPGPGLSGAALGVVALVVLAVRRSCE
ncbi:hypothetical protein [Halostella salina]|uniref:hypothetical protein n=1 Tax=Halostella salina TaxID=1547897 RepID=UPI0013CE6797|nr:hypothetical protein [Halostella salina]